MTRASSVLLEAKSGIIGKAGLELRALSSTGNESPIFWPTEKRGDWQPSRLLLLLEHTRSVKSSFRAAGSRPRGSDWLLLSLEPLLSDKSGEVFFLGDGRSISLPFLVGVPGSFSEMWEPRVSRTVGGSSGSGSDSCSDGGVGEC
jgi:hypothetical protein